MTCKMIGIVFALCVLIGCFRGLIKVILSMAGLLVSILIAVYAAPHLSVYLQEHTEIDEKIANYISEELHFDKMGEETSKGIQVSLINALPIQDNIKSSILDNNNVEMYKALGVSSVYDYIAKSIAVVFMNVMVFLVLTALCRLFFVFVGKKSEGFSRLPIVKWIDKLGGGLLGALKGIILIWLFFLLLSVTSASAWSQDIVTQIDQIYLLKLLYDHNIILDIVGDLTRILYL